jgi:hypothetical protein
VGRQRSTRFRLQAARLCVPLCAVKRPTLRAVLVFALLLSAGFAAWAWLRPYEWQADPAARCKVIGTQVRKDQSFFWVDIHLQVSTGQTHDLTKPVLLRTSGGREIKAADTLFGSEPNRSPTDLWYKFWLESTDLEGPLSLRINDGTLLIKAKPGLPCQGRKAIQYFVTNRW